MHKKAANRSEAACDFLFTIFSNVNLQKCQASNV